MARFDARQVGGQGASLRGLARCLSGRRRRTLQRRQLGLHRGNVRRHAFLEQLPLIGIHALGFGRVLQTAQARDLRRQCGDLGVLVKNRMVAGLQTLIALINRALLRGDRLDLIEDHTTQHINIGNRGEGGGVHAVHCTYLHGFRKPIDAP